MQKFKFFIIAISLGLSSSLCFAQEEKVNAESEEPKESEGKHTIAFFIGHARIGQGTDSEGKRQFNMVPSVSIDYNYWISTRFALGIHTDFLNENFYVESEEDGAPIERERPIAPALMGTYMLGEHWSFGLGFGGEFAEGEDYFVTRFAIEYGVEIRNGWAVLGSLTQDFRANAYNVTSFGIGVEKRFGN
ncbi:hypothetical protein [Algoriphagus chordae]|uniref:Outer membrane protein with beta-barrel domain n=1 Tax=Algoriphagus chordae TaxID=237019 RepID=A0A2W7QIU4_9BACT|nr:hypothetical protein [Algoriphagus chordae]PZX48528.1 hypothetical protein LV85_03598 [Algoriphagus chordae]